MGLPVMHFETLLVAGSLAVLGLWLVLATFAGGPRRVRLWALAAWAGVSGAVAWAAVDYAPPARAALPVLDRPIEVESDGYVSSRSCQACHPREYGSWYGSYHRTMTTVATPETMKAPFDGRVVEARGQRFRLEQRGDEYWVEMDDPARPGQAGVPRVERRVVQITGSHHFQFFWTATGESRKLSILPVCYRLVDEPRWMPLDGCCVGPPDTVQESETGRWNRVCNKCHATHAVPRVASQSEMDTHVAELGIACEACHGPGGEHAEENRDPRRRYASHLEDAVQGAIVNPAHLDRQRASQVCGQCHGITLFNTDADRVAWNERGFAFRPGQDILDTRHYKRDGEDKFWSDGMVRVSGREYNGLLETPCYVRGEMSCLSCHVMHPKADDPRPLQEWANDQLGVGMDGDRACTQCHEEYADPETVAAHTHHAPTSPGSGCYDCHMPYTTYGLLKAIRSHEVDSPDVAATVATGRPNACNACHLDRTLEWSARHLEEWYGIRAPELDEDQRTIAAVVLWALAGDAGQRALAAWYMGWTPARQISGSEWLTPYLALLMNDDYHAVRYISARSMREQRQEVQGYDPFDEPDERYAATLRVFEAWSQRGATGSRPEAPHLLIGPDGTLDMDTFNRLLGGRDQRRVTLNE